MKSHRKQMGSSRGKIDSWESRSKQPVFSEELREPISPGKEGDFMVGNTIPLEED